MAQTTQHHQETDSKKSVEVETKQMSLTVNILKEKQSADLIEEISEWKDEKNINWIEMKPKSLEEEASVSTSDNEVQVILMEDASIPTNAMHNYSKYSNAHQPNQDDDNSDTEQEENKLKSNMKKTQKPGSTEKPTVNIIEQVACYKCKFCMFLSLSQDAVTVHVQQEHASKIPTESNCSLQCPGCSNVFFSPKSLRVHLSEDHHVAQEKLENIMSSFKVNDRGESETGSKLNSSRSKVKQQVSPNVSNEIKIAREPSATPTLTTQSSNTDESSKPQPSNLTRGVKKGAKVKLIKKFVGKREEQQVDLSLLDETRKIRVRKLSSLEKSEQGSSVDEEPASNDASKVDSDESDGETSSTFPPQIHLNDADQETIHDDNLSMDIQYDIESMQILNIPLDQQQNEPQVQLVQEVSQTNPGSEGTLRSIVENNGHRYSVVSTSHDTCVAIIDEICPEEVLDNVLYVEEGDIIGDRDSPIVVCFPASPNNISGNGDDYDIQIADSISTGSEGQINDNNRERVVLSSCTFLDGSDVATDGKKLVKRGFVKRPASKKGRPKKTKVLKKKQNKNDQPTSAGYKCNVYGCSVRLLSHDNMEFHQRCHIPNHFSENTLNDKLEENENIPESKKRRIIPDKHSFVCPECSEELQTWKHMRSHLWKSHSIDMELYSCDHCGYKTPSLSNMRNIHIKIHGTEKPFLCDSCGKGFKTTKQLRNHKVIHIRKDAEVQTCETCGRTFHTNRMLRSHINTVHNKVRPYMCSECGHTAANRSSLKMHLRQHTGDRPYECDQCEYTTADHNSLRRHKKRHTGDKPYKCPICSYACIQSTTYKIHLRTKHPGQDLGLMFSCKKCSFHTVNHDIYLAHTAEHDLAESCGIPFKQAPRPPPRRTAKHVKISDEPPSEEVPIFVSIATGDTADESEQPNFDNIVQHVSEEILPGSNLHVLYNSISLSDSNIKETIERSSASSTILLQDQMVEVDDESELQLVGEVDNPDAVIEVPTEEYKFKLRNRKVKI